MHYPPGKMAPAEMTIIWQTARLWSETTLEMTARIGSDVPRSSCDRDQIDRPKMIYGANMIGA
jgi:hypothetical protein